MDEQESVTESKGKSPRLSQGEISPTTTSHDIQRQRRHSEFGQRIVFAPDPRERRHPDEIATLPLTRTLSRQSRFSSFSSFDDEEKEKIRRVASRRSVEPHTRLPTSYRTLSIHVTDTVTHGVEPTKGHVKDIAELEWHKISVEEALRRLGCHRNQGLDNNQAQRRLQANGKNVLSPPPTHRVRKILGYFFGGFGGLLFIAGIICIICYKPLGNPSPDPSNLALGVLLFLVITIQAIFNAWQDYSSSQIMASITGMIPAETLVLRDGQQMRIPALEIVVGDLIFVSLGNKCPADFRIIQCSGDLKFDRSVLTGESEPIAATTENTDPNFMESRNIGMQGTHVVSGNGVGLVIQTGDATVFGRIAKLSSRSSGGLTTLQKEILRFVFIIASIALSLAILVVILWAAWLRRSYPGYLGTTQLLVNAMTVLIAVIPEGLPVSVTLSLTVIAKAMGRSKVLCKSLTTVETLGAVNVLCSDKTGTLTQNKMFVQNAGILDDEYSTEQARNVIIKGESVAKETLQQLHVVSGLCNAAQFDAATLMLPISQRKINGDATDTAILRFAEELGPVSDLTANWKREFDLPFNSKNKYMIRIYRVDAGENSDSYIKAALGRDSESFGKDDLLLLKKGAPDLLLPCCSSVLEPSAEIAPLTEETRSRVASLQESWAVRGQRVLLLARKIIKANGGDIPAGMTFDHALFGDTIQEVAMKGLTIVGMVGIVDPPREDIPDVVAICRRAGIRFFMVTGDFPSTATAIARQCGIITTEKVEDFSDLNPELGNPIRKWDPEDPNRIRRAMVLSGKDMHEMKETQWEQYEEIVFARTTPEQKLRIVKEFQQRKSVVAMTGDGVNDAPSLKAADIGVAIGSGSDVAMEAADMVLMETFSSIVVCIEYGRLVFDNIKKVILYLLPAGTFCELWPILFTIFFGLPQPLSSIQMIIISMLTDCVASMSLIKEKPEADLLLRMPRCPEKDRLANVKLLVQAYLIVGVPMLVCANAMAFRVFALAGIPFSSLWLSFGNVQVNGQPVDPVLYQNTLYTAQSVYFVTLVLMQWANLLMTRTRRLSIFQQPPIGPKETRNLYIFMAMGFTISVLVLFVFTPFFQDVFHTRGVNVQFWFIPFGFGAGLLLMDETRKFLVRRFPRGLLARIAW